MLSAIPARGRPSLVQVYDDGGAPVVIVTDIGATGGEVGAPAEAQGEVWIRPGLCSSLVWGGAADCG